MENKKDKNIIVYLADLRYNFQGITSIDVMPLGIANMKAVMDQELPEVNSEIFAYPEELSDAIANQVPDVLMLTNYSWNEMLSIHYARYIKNINPSCLVVMGGPNFPIEKERQIEYLKQIKYIDVYATGEGDFYAAELVKSYIDNGLSIPKLLSTDIHSSLYRFNGGEIRSTNIKPRSRNLDDIPSPWLTGILDKYFGSVMAPLFETNRGCPFTCTFCVQGTKWYTKVSYFSMERLKEEIFYIGKKIYDVCPGQSTLIVADPNFGMYKRDIEISSYLGETQVLYNWPLNIDATTGKNQAENIIASIEKVNGALLMYQAVQSLDSVVLENINRTNISLDTYQEIQTYIKRRGLRSNSDLIIGLPGETIVSHKNSLEALINSGTSVLINFQAILLKGSELETLASRERFHFTSKFRIIPKSFGIYNNERVFDIEEIIVATSTLSFEDYLKSRTYHLIISTCWNDSRFDLIIDFFEKLGFAKWSFIQTIYDYIDSSNEESRNLIDAFLDETKNELFDSPEEVIEFYSKDDNFEKLSKSLIGDNLMYKYRALATFWYWEDWCNMVFDALLDELIQTKNPIIEHKLFITFWNELKYFILNKYTHGKSIDDFVSSKEIEFHFDILQWINDDMPIGFDQYLLYQPITLGFELSNEKVKNIKGILNLFDYNTPSMSMIVRRMHVNWREKEIKQKQEVLV